MPILSADVFYAVYSQLKNNLALVEVEGSNLPTIDEHAIEEGL
jgi:hypothetical protein